MHREKDKKVVEDFHKRYKVPHDPYQIIGVMCNELRRYKIRRVTGDNYGAEFVASAFKSNGIGYEKCKLSKSQLYIEFVPRVGSNAIQLLDDEFCVKQFAALERRVRSGGKIQLTILKVAKTTLATRCPGQVILPAKNEGLLGRWTVWRLQIQSIRFWVRMKVTQSRKTFE